MCNEPSSIIRSKKVAIRMRRRESVENILNKGQDSASTALTLNASYESLLHPEASLDTPSVHKAKREHIENIQKVVLKKISRSEDDPSVTPKTAGGKKKFRVAASSVKGLKADGDGDKTPSTPRRSLVRSLKERFSSSSSSAGEHTPKAGKKKLIVSVSAMQTMLAPSAGQDTGTPLTPRRKLVQCMKERFPRRNNTREADLESALPVDVPLTPRPLTRQSSVDLSTERLLSSLPVAAPCTRSQNMSRPNSNVSGMDGTATPRRTSMEGDTSMGALLVNLPLETPSTPQGKMTRRGSNGSMVDNLKKVFTRSPRRGSDGGMNRMGSMRRLGSFRQSGSSSGSPKKACRSSASFNSFIGNMSFGNMSITTLPFGVVRSAPFGKDFLEYAEKSTVELSDIDSLDNDFDFDQGTVTMEMAARLLRRILDETREQKRHKDGILKQCARDWELAQARKEAGNRLGYLTTIRRMHIRRMECCKHDQVFSFLETLKLVVETEIAQATSLAELSGAEAALVMPITEAGLKDEIECMLTDWDKSIDVDELNVEEADDISDFEEELFHELLLVVPRQQG